MSDNDERLERLLSAPLAPVADDGFSARVMTRIAATDVRQPWLETTVLAAVGCVVLATLPLAGLSEWIERASVSLEATGLPLAIAGLALAITWSYTRIMAD